MPTTRLSRGPLPRPRLRARPLAIAALAAVGLSGACGERDPSTDAERLARGREIIERMSAKLAGAQTLSVKTTEVRDQTKTSGAMEKATLNRDIIVRRPDRLYISASGDRRNEVWYDGVGLTIVMHNAKVYGQALMPKTLDKALDAMHERYGVATPVGDFIYSSPAKALLTESTTGGWVGRETVDGQQADRLAYKDKGVNWELWIASSGDPLPRKLTAEFPENKRLRKIDVKFSDWNFAPEIPPDRFTPRVPADYEGIAIVQRARVLRHLAEEQAAPKK